jgi:hypothetical protein
MMFSRREAHCAHGQFDLDFLKTSHSQRGPEAFRIAHRMHTVKTQQPALPPGFSTRRISLRAATLSGMNIKPIWQNITSKTASSKGRLWASHSRQSIAGDIPLVSLRARLSMSGLISTLVTEPFGPTLSAATRVSTPVPQATSRTRSPAWSFACASTHGAYASITAGTKISW